MKKNAMRLELVAQVSLEPSEPIPQGRKPFVLPALCGTAEAVPFQNTLYATSSRLDCDARLTFARYWRGAK
jgi:hypothetical protein